MPLGYLMLFVRVPSEAQWNMPPWVFEIKINSVLYTEEAIDGTDGLDVLMD